MWQFAPNSIHYLLSLWQRMVASVPYVKALEPHLLETYTPEVTHAFVTSRLESVSVVLRSVHSYVQIVFFKVVIFCKFYHMLNFRESLEDPLDDLGMVQQQLDQVSF